MHFRAVDFMLWSENAGFAHWIKGSTRVFPIVETVHIIGFAGLLSTILVVDLRLLGFGMRRQLLTERGALKQGSSSRSSERIATPETQDAYTAVEIYA